MVIKFWQRGGLDMLSERLDVCDVKGVQVPRARINAMSAEVVDSNPYSRLMALQRMGIVKDYERIRDKTVCYALQWIFNGYSAFNISIITQPCKPRTQVIDIKQQIPVETCFPVTILQQEICAQQLLVETCLVVSGRANVQRVRAALLQRLASVRAAGGDRGHRRRRKRRCRDADAVRGGAAAHVW